MRAIRQIATERSFRASFLRWITVIVMVAAIALSVSLPAVAHTKYVITDGDNVIVCMSSSSDPQEVIQEAGLTLGESDTYTTLENDGVSEIHINRIQMVYVQDGNEMMVVGSYGGTAADVLASLELTLDEADVLSCNLDTEVYDGMFIQITRVTVETETYTEIVPHGEKIYEDSSLAPGEEVVLVEGKDGETGYTAQVTYENGEEAQRDILSQQVISSPTDRVILRGVDRSVKTQENSGKTNYLQSSTDPDRKITVTKPVQTVSKTTQTSQTTQYIPGTNQPYTQLLTFQATAYTCEGYVGTTATGTTARVGAIAVDPTVIPLGTKMYIVSADGKYVYGYCTAEDTGGAIKGNIVDLYYDTYDEAIQFGRRNVLIYVIG